MTAERDELFFRVDEAGVLNTKGCIKKKNVVYWSVGTEEEMSTVTMLGDKERVFCDDEATGSSITSAPTILSSAPVTPPTNPPVITTNAPTTGNLPCETGPGANPDLQCFSLNEFCQLLEGVCNNKSGVNTGVCKSVPDNCIEIYTPVCGCDGVTYSNACKAHGSSQSVSRGGECETPKPTATDGDGDIAETEEEEGGETACLTAEDCLAKAEEMEVTFIAGDFPESATKGCFSKNGRVFFSPGTEEQMSDATVASNQERIWCEGNGSAAAMDGTSAPTKVAASTSAPTKIPTAQPTDKQTLFPTPLEAEAVTTDKPVTEAPVSEAPVFVSTAPVSQAPVVVVNTACLTDEDCLEQADYMGMIFMTGDFPIKGCYMKNGRVFFSVGTEEEMSDTNDLPPAVERVWCNASPTSSPTANVLADTVSPTVSPSGKNTTAPVEGDVVDTIPQDVDTETSEPTEAITSATPTFSPFTPQFNDNDASRGTVADNATATARVQFGVVGIIVCVTAWLF